MTCARLQLECSRSERKPLNLRQASKLGLRIRVYARDRPTVTQGAKPARNMSLETQDRTLLALREIHRRDAISQRTLAQSLGIAVGLANSLVKRLVQKGYVRVTGTPPTRVRYFLTPRGVAELTARAADSMENTLRLYTTTRDRIRIQLATLEQPASHRTRTRVIFYGAGDVAEIAYITLAGSGLDLVGVVDDYKAGKHFFEHTVRLPDVLLDGSAPEHDVVVVTSFKKSTAIAKRLAELQVPPSRVLQLSASVVECLPDLQPR